MLQFTVYDITLSEILPWALRICVAAASEGLTSQLFHLTDIVKANSAIRGSNLEDTFTLTLKLSEDGFGSVQGVPSPRTKTKFKKKIFRANIVILNVKCSQGKLVYKCAAPNSPDHPTVLNALTDETPGACQSVPRF